MTQTTRNLDAKPVWLIVEDDPSVRKLLGIMMEIWGIVPLAFADGYLVMEWLDKVERGEETVIPSLALMDIRLPGPHGHVVAQRLRQIAATAQIPVVMMTAFNFRTDEIEMIKQTAQPQMIISKPLPMPNDLRDLLERVANSPASIAA
jgi:CheY-like chemotaxis protein